MKVVIFYDCIEIFDGDSDMRVWNFGSEEWFTKDKRHRVDGPDFLWDRGNETWYFKGNRHRKYGPALHHSDGYQSWYLEGEWMGNSQHQMPRLKDEVKYEDYNI